LTADTAAELLFAISGGEIEYHVIYPLDRQAAIGASVQTEVVTRKISGVTEAAVQKQNMPQAAFRMPPRLTSSHRIEMLEPV
jgi:hypothetical protein